MEEPKQNETITSKDADKIITNWLQDEAMKVKETSFDGERKPALKLIENKITEVKVDFANPFEKWEDQENGTIKKIIPVAVNGEELVWWLNVRNPIYHQIIEKGAAGQESFKVLQTGTQKNTKYTLVD